jgi:hypothetical protein
MQSCWAAFRLLCPPAAHAPGTLPCFGQMALAALIISNLKQRTSVHRTSAPLLDL